MSDPVFCDECNAAVRLERDESGEYLLRCACDKDVSVPMTWSYLSWE